MSPETLPYPYPKLLEVLEDSHTLTRTPQTLQNITLQRLIQLRWYALHSLLRVTQIKGFEAWRAAKTKKRSPA